MMGTRERTIDGDEYDYFCRYARRAIYGGRRSQPWVKSKFWRRVRKAHRLALRRETS